MVARQRLDLPTAITGISRRLRSAESRASLGYSSITRGGIRVQSADGIQVNTVAGGLPGMRVTGLQIVEGTIRITGTLEGGGTFVWTGTLTNNGPLIQNGPWTMNGTGTIAGDVAQTGGKITSDRIRIEAGKIYIGEGATQIVIDGATGRLQAGNVTVKKDEVTVAGGAAPATLKDGALTFAGGGAVKADTITNGVEISAGDDTSAIIGYNSISMYASGNGIDINPGGISLFGDVIISKPLSVGLPTGVSGRYMIYGSDGKVYAGSSGGGGGMPGDPPAGNPEGYIWAADPAVYGISDNFAAHIARGSAEPGVDVMTPVGSPIWAPAAGTIVDVQTAPSGATGRYITLVTDEGDWFRFLHASAVSVAVNQVVSQTDLLGYTGGSGFGSEAYYGPHLHISFSIGYTGLFPGASNMNDFEAYMLAA